MTFSAILWIAVAAAVAADPANVDKTPQTASPVRQAASEGKSQDQLPVKFKKLLPLHTKLAPPQPDEWLAKHKEQDQSYSQYLRNKPIRVDRRRRVIYVQPLGEFDSAQRKVLDRTAEFLGIYFQLPVKVRKALSLDLIPATARREHPSWHVKQILSTYVLYDVLRPRIPADACVYIALTTSDLWPGEGWNFVFGQASLTERVGVWSIAAMAIRMATKRPFGSACSARSRPPRTRRGICFRCNTARFTSATWAAVTTRKKPIATPCGFVPIAWRSSATPRGPILFDASRTLWPLAVARDSRRSRRFMKDRWRSWRK